jgi:hypothetical protein
LTELTELTKILLFSILHPELVEGSVWSLGDKGSLN